MYNNYMYENKKEVWRSKAITSKIMGIIFFCIGLIVFSVNWFSFNQNEKLIAKADSVVGVCTDSRVSDNRIAVSYSYNGKEYEDIIINDHGQSFREGDEIKLFVNPNIPSWCIIECNIGEGDYYINMSMGCWFLIIGIFGFLLGWARLLEVEKL